MKYDRFGQAEVKAIAELIEASGRGGRFAHIAAIAAANRAVVRAEAEASEIRFRAKSRPTVEAWHKPGKEIGDVESAFERLARLPF